MAARAVNAGATATFDGPRHRRYGGSMTTGDRLLLFAMGICLGHVLTMLALIALGVVG